LTKDVSYVTVRHNKKYIERKIIMNYLNTITKTNVDRLIGLLDPDSGVSVTRNVYPDMINPKGHVTHKYIVDTINRDAKLSKLNTKDKTYLRRLVQSVYGCCCLRKLELERKYYEKNRL
jgi:hypothetical protein